MDTEPTNPSPEALSEFVDGVERQTRGEGEHHVAILWGEGRTEPVESENGFTSREALNEWAETLPPHDTVITFRVVYGDSEEFTNEVHPPDSNPK